MVGGWIALGVLLLYYVQLYCCGTALDYCCCTGLWAGRSVLPCRVLLSCVHTGSWVFLFPFLPLYRPRAGIVQRTTTNSNMKVSSRARDFSDSGVRDIRVIVYTEHLCSRRGFIDTRHRRQ